MDFQSLFSQYFHRKTGNKRFTEPQSDPSTWPEEWKKTYFKGYPRMPRIDLKPYLKPLPDVSLEKVLKSRRSRRAFGDSPIHTGTLSNLLYWSSGIRDLKQYIEKKDWQDSFRFYASGGARYPLEIYPLVLRGEGDLKPSLYHYYVKEHALENIWEKDFSGDKEFFEGILAYPWSHNASLILFITSVFWRNQTKYGERGYRYVLQESGHLGQNIYLVCEALGLQCCALGGFADEEVDKLIDIDGVTEASVYAFAVGPRG
ncbi:MAG: SagB/ThcOx family dehydrogenase [Parcubacteria group bacterium]|nr:SagB/ThcOx family dehydrogenase [Parcubacteria group bacterium]